MNTLLKTSVGALLLMASLGAASARAAEVQSRISTRETYVGMPVTFQVQVANAKDFDPPTLPEIPGLRIESVGTPARSTQTTIINGSMTTRSSVTYSFSLTPTQPGNFRIPAIAVRADGQTLSTKPFEFVASKSEKGDLLFVEIAGKEKEIYVGQSLDLTLRIWVRPYRDQEHGITLSEGDMWQLLSERTSWGPFADRIQAMAANGERPVGTEVLRAGRAGAKHSYYLYEIEATIYPKKPGRIDADDVQVIALYPTAIGESQDPFSSFFDDMGMSGGRGGMFTPFAPRLTIESVRPIVAEAKVEPIDVKEIPIAHRPADYRGAVGKYLIRSDATSKEVNAGDPIQLVLSISGTGPLDLVQAPPLAELPELAKDFKVPNEPLAGYVDGGRKLFATTIRPRKAGISQIPSIPFTYFDPEVGKFVTTHSKPISIHVTPADTLALEDVVGRSKAAANSSASSAAVSGGAGPLLSNYTGDDLLTSQSPPIAISWPLAFVLALPPVVVFSLLLARVRGGVALVAGRFRSSGRKLQLEIESATRTGEIDVALRKFLARRFGISAAADATTVVGSLRGSGCRNLAVRCERILQQYDTHCSIGFGNGPSLEELKRQTLELCSDLDVERCPAIGRVARRARGLRAITTAIVTTISLFSTVSTARATESELVLSPVQLKTLLAEAFERYTAAQSTSAEDSAEAKESFAVAAEKYQLVVDSGVRSAQLYLNLGNAYLESGETGWAIANYRRALALDPTGKTARTNLEFAEAMVATKAGDSQSTEKSLGEHLVSANDWLIRHVSPRTLLASAIVGWFAFWIALGLGLLKMQFPWKSVAVAALVIVVTTATSYTLAYRSAARPIAVVVTPAPALRTGDGENFAIVTGAKLIEGQSVDCLKHRGDWVQIRTSGGQLGWLPSQHVEAM